MNFKTLHSQELDKIDEFLDTKTYLNVPFAQKDYAKSIGAKWDAINKQWYIQTVRRNQYKELTEKFNKQMFKKFLETEKKIKTLCLLSHIESNLSEFEKDVNEIEKIEHQKEIKQLLKKTKPILKQVDQLIDEIDEIIYTDKMRKELFGDGVNCHFNDTIEKMESYIIQDRINR